MTTVNDATHGDVTQFEVHAADAAAGFKPAAPYNASEIESTGTLELNFKLLTASSVKWLVKVESNGGKDAEGATGQGVEIEIESVDQTGFHRVKWAGNYAGSCFAINFL